MHFIAQNESPRALPRPSRNTTRLALPYPKMQPLMTTIASTGQSTQTADKCTIRCMSSGDTFIRHFHASTRRNGTEIHVNTRFQRISPFLWFNDNAEEAVSFYVSVFENSRILNSARYGKEAAKASGRPEGSIMTIAFELDGQTFTALNGGPIFSFNPAVSLVVNCRSQAEVDHYWNQLSNGGDPNAQQCGWLKDRIWTPPHCKHSVLWRPESTAHVYSASACHIDQSMLGLDGLFARWLPIAFTCMGSTWTLEGFANAGSTGSPSYGLLRNRG
jgi:predicted 3-demethylubiquinone-9 3-methyltransferase (glyoxalase superfamily)